MRHVIGIVPAAGLSSRLRPFRYPKELLPVSYAWSVDGREIRPQLVIEHVLQAARQADATRCIVVVSDAKADIMRYLGDGSAHGLQLAYVVQEKPLGLAHAVEQACRWAAPFETDCCMAMPDTLFEPQDALQQVYDELVRCEADLVLGVFPTRRPNELGPVAVRADGTVGAVFDKPRQPKHFNTWALAAWTPRFTELLRQHCMDSASEEVILGAVFDDACRRGLSVRAVHFPEGRFTDLGTREGLAALFGRSGNGHADADRPRPVDGEIDDIHANGR